MTSIPTLTQRASTLTAIGALLLSGALVGCSRNDDPRSVPDSVVAQADQKATAMKNDAAAGLDKVKEATRDAAQDTKAAAAAATDKAGDKVADAMITTEINAELAKDPKLSALKINVDTDGGRVALRGSAPSSEARERATTLASGVKGVVSVDNQLTVDTGKT